MPFDGQFRDNVIVQVKNGPIDFQPREPFSPLFGAMQHTQVMPEFQITQEYLGQSIHTVFLPTMWKACLDAETYRDGGGTVAEVTQHRVGIHSRSAMAGVANIGDVVNWTGSRGNRRKRTGRNQAYGNSDMVGSTDCRRVSEADFLG